MDHAAATPVDARVIDTMNAYSEVNYGNPSALHKEGVSARAAVEGARKNIADILGAQPDEIIFVGSATESIALGLVGTVRAWRKAHPDQTPHIIVSAIEHDAVLETARVLEAQDVHVSIIPVTEEGIVDCGELAKAITEETVLVSMMYANNEIGTIQPIKEIAKIIRKWKKEYRGTVRSEKEKGDARYPLFHTDACQAVNYCDIRVPTLGVDLLTMNAAKIYGPKGIGLLYCARETPIEPMIVGGGHERGLRAGTENVPGIMGFAEALSITRTLSEHESARLAEIRDALIKKLEVEIPTMVINGSTTLRLPNNIHFSLPHVDHEFLALLFDANGIAVATKSACNEFDAETSHVLQALHNASPGTAPVSGIRLSFGRSNTLSDIDLFIQTLKKILPVAYASSSNVHSSDAML